MTKVKICGLCRNCDVEYVNEAKPDYVGVVFAKSKRQVNYEIAELFHKTLDKNIKVVGVFVNEPLKNVVELVENGIVDIVQLHGNEEEEYIRQLKKNVSVSVIKAIRVDNSSDILKAEKSSAEFLLLDSGSGGTGQCFDWRLIKNINKPFFLAGGIKLENVENAINMVNPYGIDVSSGVEENGRKDREKIIELIRRVRNA